MSQYLIAQSKKRRCPLCAGELYHRADDDPKIIERRLKVYGAQVKPVFMELAKRGFKISQIDGTPLPYEIHEKIISYFSHEANTPLFR